MKIIITILIFSLSSQLMAQDFTTNFIAKTQQKRDTVFVGFDLSATTEIDIAFNELDINGIRFDSILDLRSGQISIDELNCESNNLDWYPQIVSHMSKIDIVPRDCNGWDPTQTTNGLAPFSTLFVRNENLPIILSWNSSDFSNACLEGSIITDWHPGGWFDAGCPKLTVPPQKLIDIDSLSLNEPSGITIIDTFGDSISLYFVALGSQGFLDSTADIEESEIQIYPNPTEGKLNIHSPNHQIDNIAIFDYNGTRIKSFKDKKEIELNNLPNGIYLVKIETIEGQILKRVMKYGQ